ncbi:hypothetical protein FMM01_12105 [Schleiferilactobacillus harbinensis]|uniref:hypothetical protein n=1 Tax=Schleiferilactobacillus harbinensis TaxID=304207 RepID=UPI00123B669D|nr:hypothetical protein [Schleiferilactobacillus harbinensis]QEU47991.1 hypothetical protein FMM01_12105 [Schleiferilactobacillus harbinensis]
MLFILVGAGRIQAQAAGAAEYPAWVRQAVVGTAYTADEFVGLPFEQQLQIVQTLHPELATAQAAISTAMAAATPTNAVAPPNLAAAAVSGSTYLDIAPSSTGYAFAYFNSAGAGSLSQTVQTGMAYDGAAPSGYIRGSGPVFLLSPAKTIDPGSLTDTDFKNLQAGNFVFDAASSSLNSGDVTLSYAKAGAAPPSVTLFVKNSAALPYNGKTAVYNVTINSHKAQITFNLWRPDVTRAAGVLPLGNNLSLRYMFGKYRADQTTSHDNYDITQVNNAIDVPNMNILQANSANPTVNTLYESMSSLTSSQKDGIMDFTHLSTSLGLAIGREQSAPITVGSVTLSPMVFFDDIKHIHMYADSTNANIIHLDYDGYISNPHYVRYVLGVLEPNTIIHLKVQSILQPSPDNRQMMMSESVTNQSGVDLTGLYFGRQLDTQLGTNDNIPLYYGPLAQEGPRAGKPQGLYFRASDLTPPLAMQFNFNAVHGPDSWSGTHWISPVTIAGPSYSYPSGTQATQYRSAGYVTKAGLSAPASGFPGGAPVFQQPEGKGNAGDPNAKPDQLLFGGIAGGNLDDSAIIMKWSPSQVGPFKDGDTFEMGFNSVASSGTAPVVRTDTNSLRVLPTATTVPVSGGVFDLNSQKVTVYYQVDGTPVTTANALSSAIIANRKPLYAGQYTVAPPHTDYLNFPNQMITDVNDVKLLADGKPHTIYVYAVDTPDLNATPPYAQTDAMASNVKQIAVNQPAKVNVHLLDSDGTALTPTQSDGTAIANPVVKNGFMADSYNFSDFSIGSTSILATPATTLQGHPPLTLTSAGQQYDLDQTRLPSNGQGTLDSASGTLDLNYYYKKHSDTGGLLKLTVPTIDFGQQSLNLGIGSYPISSLTGSLVVTNQNTTNKSFQLSAQATTPLTNAAGQTLPGALGYQLSGTTVADLSDPVIVYANTNAAAPDTTFNISNSWWQANQPQTGDYQIGGPRLQINAVNKPAISAGKYTGVITWTVTNGL